MESILEQLDLGTLLDTFSAEKVDPNVVISMSEGCLIRLGVSTVGDRIRIKELCKEYVEIKSNAPIAQSSSSDPSSIPSAAEQVREERRHLFRPYNQSSAQRKAVKRKAPARRTWTATFFCLANRHASRVPSSAEKQILQQAGLGLKKIRFYADDSEKEVKEKLTSGIFDETGAPLGFPQLNECKGFEILSCSSNSRDLTVVKSSWSVKELKSLFTSQTKIYLRPIQKSLRTKNTAQSPMACRLMETCMWCQKQFPVNELRAHLVTCACNFFDDDPTEDTPVSSTLSTTVQLTESTHLWNPVITLPGNTTPAAALSLHNAAIYAPSPPGNSTQTGLIAQAAPLPLGDAPLGSSTQPGLTAQAAPLSLGDAPLSSSTQPGLTAQAAPLSLGDAPLSSSTQPGLTAQAAPLPLGDAPPDSSEHPALVTDQPISDDFEIVIETALPEIIEHCNHTGISNNPVEILRYLQTQLVRGRALDVVDPTHCEGGETNYILVDRKEILETTFDEIETIKNKFLTLEVQFYNELAEDYGGPRKEFFTLCLKAIKDRFFDDGLLNHQAEMYHTIGVILGLSVLQNGPMPTFLGEEKLDEIFFMPNPSQCLLELRNGLSELGIVQIANEFPVFMHLMRRNDASILTLKKLVNMLKPDFAEDGSNRRLFENAVYSNFHKYLRKAATGQRGDITLSHILRFVTGAENEPILGFSLQPSIIFVAAEKGFVPTANTCVNTLKLPRATTSLHLPHVDTLFNIYDYAFANAYFGNI